MRRSHTTRTNTSLHAYERVYICMYIYICTHKYIYTNIIMISTRQVSIGEIMCIYISANSCFTISNFTIHVSQFQISQFNLMIIKHSKLNSTCSCNTVHRRIWMLLSYLCSAPALIFPTKNKTLFFHPKMINLIARGLVGLYTAKWAMIFPSKNDGATKV